MPHPAGRSLTRPDAAVQLLVRQRQFVIFDITGVKSAPGLPKISSIRRAGQAGRWLRPAGFPEAAHRLIQLRSERLSVPGSQTTRLYTNSMDADIDPLKSCAGTLSSVDPLAIPRYM